MSPPVLLDRHGCVASITLNRPDRANVLDLKMATALIGAIDTVANDPSIRGLLLRASGRHFCAGGDIGEFLASLPDLGALLDRTIPPIHRTIHRLATLPFPVVSALNGSVGGGGIGLALSADIVLAAESMKLRGGYSAIGLTPDAGSSWLLTRRVGPARAKEIFFTNEVVPARQCLAIGAVSQVYPDDQLEARALELVASLARSATGSLGRIKALVDGAAGRSLQAHLDLEHRLMVESGNTKDAVEGVTAFAQKRAPEFGSKLG